MAPAASTTEARSSTLPLAQSEFERLQARAAAKQRRLRLFGFILCVTTTAFVVSAKMPWYEISYEQSSFNGVTLTVRPVFTLDAGQMAEVARSQPASYTVNPTVDQVMGLPVFAIAAVAGALIGLIGLFFRSTALTLLGAGPLLFAWIKLAQARYWFESAPGRDGWAIERASGQALFWLALMVSAAAIAAGAYQASVAYRADRQARAAGGQQVEDTAFDMFVRVIARGAVGPSPSATSSTRSSS